jgi:hypothetical protein
MTNEDIIKAIKSDPIFGDETNYVLRTENDLIWFGDITGGCPAPLWTDGEVIKSAELIGVEETSAEFERNPENVEIYRSNDEMIKTLFKIFRSE